MFPINMAPVHLWMGLAHPIFGPANMFWYSTFMAYAWYLSWVDMVMAATRATGPSRPTP